MRTETAAIPRRASKRGATQSRNATADRAFDALMLFDEDTPELTASAIAARLGAARSTIYRYIHSLRDYGLLEEAPSGALRPGPAVDRLARIRRHSNTIAERALPTMKRLAHDIEEVVILTRLQRGAVVCEQRVDPGKHTLRIVYERGQVLPLADHVGGAAIVLLAQLDERDAENMLALAASGRTFADNSDIAFARAQLAVVRKTGCILLPPHPRHGVRGVAALVRCHDHDAVASLGVIGPNVRLTDARLNKIIGKVRAACSEIEAALRT